MILAVTIWNMKHLANLPCFLVLLVICLYAGTPGYLRAEESSAELAVAPTAPVGIQGLWSWRFDTVADPAKRQKLLDFCQANHVNLLMMQIHTLKDCTQLRDASALASLVTQAAEMHIAVEALEGGADMAEKVNLPTTLARLDMILAFNQTLPANKKMVGVHYDIEPYTLPAWKQSPEVRQQIMKNLLDFAHMARKKLDAQTPPMTLAFDIPFWYDHKTKPDDNCVVTYDGQIKNLYQHMLDVSDYLGIMSYRRMAKGSNGVLKHIQNELDYARQIGKKIVPALETTELKSSPTITFFGMSASEFWTQHNTVRQTLCNDPAFGGMLTHSYLGLQQLLASPSSHGD